MTHFVVESTLRIPNGFYSLVLNGWNIEDFAVKGVGKTLPNEANLVEAIVSRLQQTVMPGSEFTPESFNDEVLAVLEGIGNPARRAVSFEELELMRSRLKQLLADYKSVPAGEAITLNFSPIK